MKPTLRKTFNHNGKEMTLRQWSVYLGVNLNTIYARFHRGLPMERVLSEEKKLGRPYNVHTKWKSKANNKGE